MLQLGINYTPRLLAGLVSLEWLAFRDLFYLRLFRVLMNMCAGAERGASYPFQSPSSLNRDVYVIIIKALNVRVHQFSSVSAGQMPLSAIMILSSQAALCCTTLMAFLLAVPGKATASWTLITKQALLCSESAQGPGIWFRASSPQPDSKTSIWSFDSSGGFSVTVNLCTLCNSHHHCSKKKQKKKLKVHTIKMAICKKWTEFELWTFKERDWHYQRQQCWCCLTVIYVSCRRFVSWR